MTWTAPDVTRNPEPFTGDERSMLDGFLDYQRATLLEKCAGLTPEQLRTRAVEPSTLTLHGLVRHMADVERWWFRIQALGADLQHRYSYEGNWDGEFDDVDRADAEADYAAFLEEVDLARQAVAGLPLDTDLDTPHRGTKSLRWVYLHMIEEYARHNGHADLLRERIDGRTGD